VSTLTYSYPQHHTNSHQPYAPCKRPISVGRHLADGQIHVFAPGYPDGIDETCPSMLSSNQQSSTTLTCIQKYLQHLTNQTAAQSTNDAIDNANVDVSGLLQYKEVVDNHVLEY
jgi:hypothetical protein